jgi:hypothetical protein
MLPTIMTSPPLPIDDDQLLFGRMATSAWSVTVAVGYREIARRLELLEPPAFEEQSETGPAQRPAAIEPVWENGVLTLPKTTAILTSKISNLLRRCGSQRRPRSGR